MQIKIGTRGSRLALTQTEQVAEALKALDPGIRVDVVVIRTTGDKIQDRSLDKIGDKGLFVKEIEEQLALGAIDMAVHSMKDMPTEEQEAFLLLPCLAREAAYDVLVARSGIASLAVLPQGAIIGTGSKRRAVQMRQLAKEPAIRPIRGNVETRIRKMLEEGMDGTLLAAAGLRRLGIEAIEGCSIVPIEPDAMIPAPAQGILACQVPRRSQTLIGLLGQLQDPDTVAASRVERAFLKASGGGCHLPVGAYLEKREQDAVLHCLFGPEDCSFVEKRRVVLPGERIADWAAIAGETAKDMAAAVARRRKGGNGA